MQWLIDALWQVAWGNSAICRTTESLQERYNWLKSSDRNAQMGILSATNRRTLLLLPGIYTITSMFVLDTNFVDVVCLSGDPSDAVLAGEVSPCVVKQTASDIILFGFTIKNTSNLYVVEGKNAFGIDAADNSPSIYKFMHFRHPYGGKMGPPPIKTRYCVIGYSDIRGTWSFCEADAYAWRPTDNKTLGATMTYCSAGKNSFGSDAANSNISGTLRHCTALWESFGGCVGWGCNITETALLEDCIAGDKSYAMGMIFAGTAKRCVGGDKCFAGCADIPDYYGTFLGYAEDCVASDRSFGSGHANSKCSGQLVRCKCTAMPETIYCEGAKIRDSYLQVAGTNKHCITLNNGNTKLYNNTLIANGNGNSIYAAAAQNVLALHCRTNKDKHANVTNLVGDGSLAAGYCIVSSEVI